MVDIQQVLLNILTAAHQGHPLVLLAMVGVTAITDMNIPTMGVIDATLIYVGYQFSLFSVQAFVVILAFTIGRAVGSSVIFWLSRKLGPSFIARVERHTPSLCSSLNKVAELLNRSQVTAVVIARSTPGLLLPSSVASGILRTNYWNFLIGVGIHAVISDVVLILIGFLGREGANIAGITPKPWQIIVTAFVLVSCISLVIFFIQQRRSKKLAGKTGWDKVAICKQEKDTPE